MMEIKRMLRIHFNKDLKKLKIENNVILIFKNILIVILVHKTNSEAMEKCSVIVDYCSLLH